MDDGRIAERELLALIADHEQSLALLGQRLLAGQQQRAAITHELVGLHVALGLVRRKHGLQPPEQPAMDPTEAAAYHHKSAREMIARWAAQHQGRVVLKELCGFLTRAGLFQNVTQAHGTLTPTLRRMPGFEHIARGVYHSAALANGREVS